MNELHEIVGVMHIHSRYSDGSGKYTSIIKAASELNLDFLLFSDHWSLEPKRLGFEGFHDSVLVGIGCELNDQKLQNHLLCFQIDEEFEEGPEAIDYTRKAVESGAWTVVAHPDERRNHFEQFPSYPWTAWETDDFHAIEIWNHLSEWMERLTKRNKWWLYVNPRRSVIRPTAWTLEKWDDLNLKRHVVGVGGVDAHAHHYPIWKNLSATIFPYKVAFRSIQVHVLLDTPLNKRDHNIALDELFAAMKKGRIFINNRYVGNARGFRYWAESENGGNIYHMGDRLPADARLRFHYRLPADATSAVLLKNSQPVQRIKDHSGSYNSSGPGVYRIEVFRNRRAFTYSNPIVIEA